MSALNLRLGEVYCCDALDLMRALPDESIDLVVTSPPYNLLNSTGNGLHGDNGKNFWSNQPMRNGYATDTDDMPHDEYIAWQRECLDEMMRIIPEDGAIFYNHKWRVQGGVLQRLADEITTGFPVRQIIIWDRSGGFNFNRGYFVPTYEVIYMICKSEFALEHGANGLKDIWRIAPAQSKSRTPTASRWKSRAESSNPPTRAASLTHSQGQAQPLSPRNNWGANSSGATSAKNMSPSLASTSHNLTHLACFRRCSHAILRTQQSGSPEPRNTDPWRG